MSVLAVRRRRARSPLDHRAATLALLVALLNPGCTCRALSGPTVALEDVARTYGGPQTFSVNGASVAVRRMVISRALGEPDRRPPRVIFWADGEGQLDGQPPISFSYLGVERVELQAQGGSWEPLSGRFPALSAALLLLSRRADAAGDPSKLAPLAVEAAPDRARLTARPAWPHPRPTEWVLRADPDQVLVTEVEVDGTRLSSRLIWQGGTLRFASGLIPD